MYQNIWETLHQITVNLLSDIVMCHCVTWLDPDLIISSCHELHHQEWQLV